MQILNRMQLDFNHDWTKLNVVEGMLKKIEGEVHVQ